MAKAKAKKTAKQAAIAQDPISSRAGDITAAAQVFGTYELLQAILLHLPPKDVLLFQSVNRTFKHVYDSSPAVRKMFELQLSGPCKQVRGPHDYGSTYVEYPLTPACFFIPTIALNHEHRMWTVMGRCAFREAHKREDIRLVDDPDDDVRVYGDDWQDLKGSWRSWKLCGEGTKHINWSVKGRRDRLSQYPDPMQWSEYDSPITLGDIANLLVDQEVRKSFDRGASVLYFTCYTDATGVTDPDRFNNESY